jgi:hypothetical protein
MKIKRRTYDVENNCNLITDSDFTPKNSDIYLDLVESRIMKYWCCVLS